MRIEKVVKKAADAIFETCDPEAVVLFGSHAKGTGTVQSDLDFIVIANFRGPRGQLVKELKERFHGWPIQVDLHLVTSSEVASELARPRGFLASALSGGVVVRSRDPEYRFPGR